MLNLADPLALDEEACQKDKVHPQVCGENDCFQFFLVTFSSHKKASGRVIYSRRTGGPVAGTATFYNLVISLSAKCQAGKVFPCYFV